MPNLLDNLQPRGHPDGQQDPTTETEGSIARGLLPTKGLYRPGFN